MKVKTFKPAMLALAAFLTIYTAGMAQTMPPAAPKQHALPDTLKFDNKAFKLKMEGFEKELELSLKDIGANLAIELHDIAPAINMEFKDFNKNLDLNIAPEINEALKSLNSLSFNDGDDKKFEKRNNSNVEKIKNYSKSYTLDASDKIKLSNQYGKIVINTWDKQQVKVDVQIKAAATDEAEAQKLLDGVQINDSKNGDEVSFRTEIIHNGSAGGWGWSGTRAHKIEINYTVYMPAKTDLNVGDSYGAITLPNLDGKVTISSSYGSLLAQNLTNPSVNVQGSYASLKIGSINSGHLNCSYTSVDVNECNNLNADISYGAFKLGGLKGSALLNLSYASCNIAEIAGTFKKLNISSTYAGVSLGVADNNNFGFDITTTLGGFSYKNNDKVTITAKTPADGSGHYSSTKNYKGYFGKDGTDAKINISSTYGGVSFK